MENSMWTIEKMKIKKNIVINFHLLTESQRLPNMLGQRLYNMLGQRLNNTLGQHFLDEQSQDGFASRNQRWPNENCNLKPNVGPTSTCYLGYRLTRPWAFWKFSCHTLLFVGKMDIIPPYETMSILEIPMLYTSICG